MKKVLIYSISLHGDEEAMALQEAKEYISKGNSVLYLSCDESLCGCKLNPLFKRNQCKMCSFLQHARMKRILPIGVVLKNLKDYSDKNSARHISEFKYAYANIAELKSLTYCGVKIGYAALSTYITLTRNLDAQFMGAVKLYIDILLQHQIRLTDSIIRILDDYKPDLIYLFNGRFAEYRPVLDLARIRNIEFVVTENVKCPPNCVRRNLFYNSIPHDAYACNEKYEIMWKSYSDPVEREKLARSFYENRRNAVFAGDKIYVKEQQNGLMPPNWDKAKDNIVIFNSSEDEFCSINERIDSERVFPTQIDGICTIVAHYKNDGNKHFWLRVHPNLKGLPFHYHQDLYKLSYSNLTVIPADSPISTYALMDAASKVIVFGSTTGIEATYWGKPVINLVFSYYNPLHVVHTPKTEKELWKLIDDQDLPCLYNDNVLKFGLFPMSVRKMEDNHDFPMDYKTYSFFGKKLYVQHYRNYYFHSLGLTALVELVAWKLGSLLSRNPFKKVPID